MERAGTRSQASWWATVKQSAAERWSAAERRARARRAVQADLDRVRAGSKGGESGSAARERPARLPGSYVMPAGSVAAPEELTLVREEQKQTREERLAACAIEPGARGIAGVLKRTFKEFGEDNGTLIAAALAFYITLALIPLVLVAISVLGYALGGSAQAQVHVIAFLKEFIPGLGSRKDDVLIPAINSVIAARKAVGIAGLVGLAITASGGFETLETAINVAWNTPKRGFLKSKLFALGMMLVVGLLLIATLGATAVVKWATALPGLAWLGQHGFTRVALGLAPLLISAAMFTAIYKLFPNVKSSWRPALISGVATAVLWEAFKWVYLQYSTHFMHQEATYGTLAGFVGLIMWIYYSSALVLLGAELAWVLEGCPGKRDAGLGAMADSSRDSS